MLLCVYDSSVSIHAIDPLYSNVQVSAKYMQSMRLWCTSVTMCSVVSCDCDCVWVSIQVYSDYRCAKVLIILKLLKHKHSWFEMT